MFLTCIRKVLGFVVLGFGLYEKAGKSTLSSYLLFESLLSLWHYLLHRIAALVKACLVVAVSGHPKAL